MNVPNPIKKQLGKRAALNALAYLRNEPAAYCDIVLGQDMWDAQCTIMQSILTHKEIAVRSCHGIGKSFTAACVVHWFLVTHPRSIVISTAPSGRQVRGVLWKEIRALYRDAKAQLGGRCLTTKWDIAEDWFAWGFTASEYDPDKFIGFHAEDLLVVADEAAGISENIYDGGISGLLSSDNAKMLMIGNPTNPTGYFAHAFKNPRTAKIKISAWDTPNFTTFGITRADIINGTWEDKIDGRPLPRPYLVTPEWTDKMYRRWGTDSPLWIAKVEADFPPSAPDALIPLHWVEAAQARTLDPGPDDAKTLGGDVARSGDDATIVYLRHGNRARLVHEYRGFDTTMVTAGKFAEMCKEHDAEEIYVDSIGIGAGVCDRLQEMRDDGKIPTEVIEACASASAKDPEQFLNARAEWYWHLRTAFEEERIDIDPKDEELANQLASIKRKFRSDMRIQIESKRDMKARGLPSPDKADALAYCWAKNLTSSNDIIVI